MTQRIETVRCGGNGRAHARGDAFRARLLAALSRARAVGDAARARDVVEGVLGANAARLAAWWTPPPPRPADVVCGTCDFCGRDFECREGEYFTKFKWTYCKAKCLRLHREANWAPPEATPDK